MATTVRLGDLYIGIPESGKAPGDRARRPIQESPYYLALKNNDAGLFKRYAKWTSTPSKNTWANFMSVHDSIRREGYRAERGHPVVIIHDGTHWQVVNGHHRMAILRKLHGADGKIQIAGKYVKGVVGVAAPAPASGHASYIQRRVRHK